MSGINRANSYEKSIRETSLFPNEHCIFISHKSEDMEAAEAVANYIRAFDIDVYLDKFDRQLQVATHSDDAHGIVSYIETALSESDHILVLLTDKTKDSWWVPYEVGFSKHKGTHIASLLLRTGFSFPSFLEIEPHFATSHAFEKYLKGIQKDVLFHSFNESASYSEWKEREERKRQLEFHVRTTWNGC